MLGRSLYHGVITWNQTQKTTQRGTRTVIHRPPADWLTISAPTLRIIPEDLWLAVDARRQTVAARYPRSARGGIQGRAIVRGDDESPYLLTNFGTCTACGGPMGTITRLHGPHGQRKPARFYGCTRRRRGPEACPNRSLVRHELLDAAVLLKLAARLRETGALDAAVREAATGARAHATTAADRRPALERDLATAGDRIARLVDAIALAGSIPELLARLTAEKARQAALRAERARYGGPLAGPDHASWRRRLHTRAAHVSQALAQRRPDTGQLLRDLLGPETIALTPVGRRAYRFAGRICLGTGPLHGVAAETSRIVVSPTGFATPCSATHPR
jgi:hypothetical protein